MRNERLETKNSIQMKNMKNRNIKNKARKIGKELKRKRLFENK